MIERVTPHLVNLVYHALLKSFNRKRVFANFLTQCGFPDSLLSTWLPGETKRELLDRTLPRLARTDAYNPFIFRLAKALAEQTTFPDLESFENTRHTVAEAKKAVADLRQFLNQQDDEVAKRKEKEAAQQRLREKQAEAAQSRQSLERLNGRLEELCRQIGTQEAGYAFQDWFFELLEFCEVLNRRPYVQDGRQIDGSLTVSGTTYLTELKFTKGQADAPDIDIFHNKVRTKADNTMGIMVSMAGYSCVAISTASGPATPLLLLDANHLFLVLRGVMSWEDVVDRVRRHASQTGEAYLAAARFSGG